MDKIVSVIIPVRNEGRYINDVLKSLENQTYDKTRLEIIIVDGDSDDETIKNIKEYKKNSKLNITILINKKKIIPISLNLGIKKARGDYVVRLDGHSIYNDSYIESGIIEMETRDEIVSVGGYLKINASEKKFKAFVTSKIFASPFGTGVSKLKINYFTKMKEQYNDTALYGIYRKEQLQKINGFNEKLVATQDIELYDRLKKTFNGKIYLTPKMRIEYIFKPKNGYELFKRQLRISRWLTKRNNGIRIRHLIPLIVAIVGISLLIINIKILLALLCVYLFLAIIFYNLEIEKLSQVLYTPYACYSFFMNHFGYFLGTVLSITDKLVEDKNA